MKDLHTHILHNIDNGSSSLEESLEMIKNAYLHGVTDIVLTPLYSTSSGYIADNKTKNNLLKELKTWLEWSNISINLYLGNVVDLDDSLLSLNKEISTINNSRYLLVDLNINDDEESIIDKIKKIKSKNIVPIIVCPNKWGNYYKREDFLLRLKEMGCLFQGNIKGLYIRYGYKNNIMLKLMLKRDIIDFMASDIHNSKEKIYQKDYKRKLFKITKSWEKINKLLNDNFDKVINNLEIISQEK